MVLWREFKAMGTEVIITASLEAQQQYVLDQAEQAVLNFEHKFSRFIEGNELSLLNNARTEQSSVSETMAELLVAAKHYYEETEEIFDPTVIGSLEAIGYKHNFSEIRKSAEINSVSTPNLDNIQQSFAKRVRLSALTIKKRMINRPLGLRIDLGGIGKGFIIDNLSNSLFAGINNYWISAGGDIIAAGNQENGQGWDIGVQNPLQPDKNIFSINTRGEKMGIATSGVIKRTGLTGDFRWHHLIDPRNGLPAVNEILAVTVMASNVLRADIFAKTVLILGEEAGLNFIEKESDAACIIFSIDKAPIFSKRARYYLNIYEEQESI